MHAALVVEPTIDEYVPGTHERHCEDTEARCTLEYVPAWQLTHEAAVVEPTKVEYVPEGQFTHELTLEPMEVE